MNAEMKSLKRRLTQLSLSIRSGGSTRVDINVPRLVETDSYYIQGHLLQRKRIILRSNGCTAASCTMCPFTNETTYGSQLRVQEANYLEQLAQAFALDSPDDYNVVSIYNDGSFFSEAEMPKVVRRHIYAMIAKSKCELLVVESLPQFITEERLKEAVEELTGTRLSVGIGLQSASSLVRELCVNTCCRSHEFANVIGLLRKYGCAPKVYLLIKPPFLTEREAIEDAVVSAQYLYSYNIRDVTFCPVRVSKNTIVSVLHSFQMYRPPWLWSIISVLREVAKFLRPRVACLNLRKTDFTAVHPANCVTCSDSVVEAIEAANTTGDFAILDGLQCKCLKQYGDYLQEDKWGGQAIPERISLFLKVVEDSYSKGFSLPCTNT